MNDQTIEQEIQAKGKTAPRVTPSDIEANIASEHYFTAAQGHCGAYAAAKYTIAQEGEASVVEVLDVPASLDLLTFCVIVLRNGFTVTGESACASPENFDAEIGCKIARQNAVQKIWPLMGYALKQAIHGEPVHVKPAPYTWADVGIHQAHRRDFDGMLVFKLHMRDGCIYEGSIPAGHRWPESAAAMLAECNRQRDQAPE